MPLPIIKLARTTSGLNLRSTPTVAPDNIIAQIPSGEIVRVLDNIAPLIDPSYGWRYVLWEKHNGFAADAWLRFVDTAPVPQPTKSRIGLHVLPNADPSLVEFFGAMHQSGRPVPVTLVAYMPGAGYKNVLCADIKRASPSTFVVARLMSGKNYSHGDWNAATRSEGRSYYNYWSHLIRDDIRRHADFVQIMDLNEPFLGRGSNEWFNGVLDGAEADGLKMCLPTWSVGYPALPTDTDPMRSYWQNADTHALIRRIRDGGHAFGLHQYSFDATWDDDFTIWRNERLVQYWPPDLRGIRKFITEFGWSFEFGGRSTADYGGEVFKSNLLLAEPRLAAANAYACLWTLGDSGGWERDRIEQFMSIYRSHLLRLL